MRCCAGCANMGADSLPLLSLNHISRVVRDVEASIQFYTEVRSLTSRVQCCVWGRRVSRQQQAAASRQVGAARAQVLGFIEIKRPSSFDFEGAWCALRAASAREAAVGLRLI